MQLFIVFSKRITILHFIEINGTCLFYYSWLFSVSEDQVDQGDTIVRDQKEPCGRLKGRPFYPVSRESAGKINPRLNDRPKYVCTYLLVLKNCSKFFVLIQQQKGTEKGCWT